MRCSFRRIPDGGSLVSMSALLGVVALAAAGCGSDASHTPEGPASSPTPLPVVRTITTVAGGDYAGFGGDGGPATSAMLHNPTDVAVNSAGDIFIADYHNNRVRRVDGATGVITTYAGDGRPAFGGDGHSATSASLDTAIGLALDRRGDLYISDYFNNRVRRVDAATHVITTVAGVDRWPGTDGDSGPGAKAFIYRPAFLATDSADNLFIAEAGGWKVRRVDAATHIITTFAGSGEWKCGDVGPAATTGLSPEGLAVDTRGDLFVVSCDEVFRVDVATGMLVAFAGIGQPGFGGDGGPAVAASFHFPADVALDSGGNAYIADSGNHRIRRVDAATGIITTIVGTGRDGFAGDGGPAADADLSSPRAVAFGRDGALYIADLGNQRIRKVR
jgi:sugar lactone lactonase YvrE